MPDLIKMFWFSLFIFLNYAAFDTAAQNTNPASLNAKSYAEALSQNNLEVHVKGNLSGHIELNTLEVITTTFPNKLDPTTESNETPTEAVLIKGKIDEDILENPFDSEEIVRYSSEEKSNNENVYLQSANPLSYADNSENDEEAAAKELTDGFKSNDVINGSETSGNFVAINEEHGPETPVTYRRAPLSESYNVVNDTNKQEDEGASATEKNEEETLFTESDEESDESLFELNDPTEASWFGVNLEEEANTYSPSEIISKLEDIRKLLTETPTEMPLDLSTVTYRTEVSTTNTANEQKPSTDYSEIVNDRDIENSDKESDTVEIISEGSKEKVEIDLLSDVENNSNSEISPTESNEEHSINQENVEEYISEDVKNDEIISPPTILAPENMEEPQSSSFTRISINEEDKVSVLENNEELATTAASSDLSIDETDEDSARAVSNSIEIEEDDIKFFTNNSNEDIPTDINEDRLEKESIETDSANANDENVAVHISISTTDASIVQNTEIFPATTTAITDEANKDNISDNISQYTEEDSTEILPDFTKYEDKNELVNTVSPTTPPNIVDAFTEPIPLEEDIVPEEINIEENNSSEVSKEGEGKVEPEEHPEIEIIDNNEGDSEVADALITDSPSSSENESTETNVKTDDKFTTLAFLDEGSLVTTEATEAAQVSSNISSFEDTYTTEKRLYIVEDETTTIPSLIPKTNNLRTRYEVNKIIPVFETLEEFDIVEPEGLANDISDGTNLNSMQTDSVEYEEFIDSIEDDTNTTGNIIIENQSKGYDANTENSNQVDVDLFEKVTYAAALEINDPKVDSSTIKNKPSDELDSSGSEEYVTEENYEANSEKVLFVPSETLSFGMDSVALNTETTPKEEEADSEITLEPETEVNSDKAILSEESDWIDSEEYEGISEERVSAVPTDMSLDTETAPKVQETEESNSVESEEYPIEENYEEMSQEIPSNGNFSDAFALINPTEIAPQRGIYEINNFTPNNNFLTATETLFDDRDGEIVDSESASKEEEMVLATTTEVNLDEINQSKETDLAESEEHVTEENYEGVSIKFAFPLIDPTENVPAKNYEIEANGVKTNNSFLTRTETSFLETSVIDTEAPSKEEAESDIIHTETTEVISDEISQSEELESAKSEEYAPEENYEGIPKKFSSEENLPDTLFTFNDFLTVTEPSAVETGTTTVDVETESKKETEREIILKPTTEVNSDEIILSEESDSVESEEYTETNYEGVTKVVPDNFPSTHLTEIIPVKVIEETKTAVNPEAALKKEDIEPEITFETITVSTDKIIDSVENSFVIPESSEEFNSDTNDFNHSEVSVPTNKNVSFSPYKKTVHNTLNEVSSVSQNLNQTEDSVSIMNGTLTDILNYLNRQILIRSRNLTMEEDGKINGEGNNEIDLTIEDEEEAYEEDVEYEEEISSNHGTEMYKESDETMEDLSDEIISDGGYIPYIHGKAFENDVNVSIKVVAEETTFYVPPYAYLLEDLDKLVLNVTWASSNKILNNSLSLTLTQISKYYVINGVQLNIVRDNDMLIWKKNVVILPKKADKSGEYDCVIEFEDGVEVSISNIDFLSKSSAKENKDYSDVNSSTSEIKGKRVYQIEIAAGSMAIALMLAAMIYFVIKKAKKRSLKSKNFAAQHVAA